MRKVHVKMVLDVFVEADDDANIVDRLTESQLQFTDNALDEVGDILSIDIKEVSITDSR